MKETIIVIVLIILILLFYKLNNYTQQKEYSNKTKIEVYHGDITDLDIECIVNASNPSGLGCNIPNHCIDSAIHLAAGPDLLEECKKLGGVPTGAAKLTKGYNLLAKYIIHCTGPKIEQNDTNYDFDMLRKCYINILDLAKKNQIKEIALCCISTGLYGYPKKESAEIAYKTIINWLKLNKSHDIKIVFVTFTEEDYLNYTRLVNLS